MTRRFFVILGVMVGALWAGTGTASAQFETPNRAFHNQTAFPLDGKHQTVACESCHIKGVFKGTPNTCYDCHWLRRQDDRFRTRLGTQCEQCHRPITWTAVSWDHAAATGVPLSAPHRTVGCESCHTGGEFKAAVITCVGCHQKDFQSAQNPNHVAAGFPTQCEACHRASDSSFHQARFDHNASYPLVGAHVAASCASCHRNGLYRGTPRECVACHRTDYERTQNPNHAAAGFPTACETCHRPSSPTFTGTTFAHNTVFPLVGLHATQTCAACHRNNVFQGTPRDCVGCHRQQYERTENPNHVQAGFATSCENCHRATDSSWRTGSGAFNHNSFFPLQGVHATQACVTCHSTGIYRGTPRDCVGCHRPDYDRAANPNHVQAGFPTSCESCHRATDPTWRNGTAFNHGAFFQLQGVHAQQQCATCHVNSLYRGTPRDCVGCHRSLYDRTTRPAHAPAGFPTTCEQCHRATDPAWTGVTFNHNTFFQLQGVHAQQACATCHANNVYRGTPRDCIGCHRAQYDRTTSPNHAAAAFPTTCDTCHRATDARWTGITFNHTQFFALQGVHAQRPCSACHINNVYRGTPRDCYGCHRTNYERTTNPSHIAAGFPTTCQSCHNATDTAWTQGRFTHTQFPLTGRHNVPCAQCHTTPNNFQVFNCLVCHDRATTDGQHRGRAGYSYDSVRCYQCHPNGRAG